MATKDGGRVGFLEDGSFFTASRALLLPELLTAAGDPPGEHGWLLALPDRHHLAWHVIRDASVVPSITALVHLAASGYAESAGGLSPHVYWWNGTAYLRLTEYLASGRVELVVDGEFPTVLDAVC